MLIKFTKVSKKLHEWSDKYGIDEITQGNRCSCATAGF